MLASDCFTREAPPLSGEGWRRGEAARVVCLLLLPANGTGDAERADGAFFPPKGMGDAGRPVWLPLLPAKGVGEADRLPAKGIGEADRLPANGMGEADRRDLLPDGGAGAVCGWGGVPGGEPVDAAPLLLLVGLPPSIVVCAACGACACLGEAGAVLFVSLLFWGDGNKALPLPLPLPLRGDATLLLERSTPSRSVNAS